MVNPNELTDTGMAPSKSDKTKTTQTMPLFLEEKWKSAYGYAHGLPTAERLWHLVFTDEDRARFGDDFVSTINSLGTVGMWRKVRGGTEKQAVIAINLAIGQLDAVHAEAILRHFGERPRDKPDLHKAIENASLVIDESTRTAWWHSVQMDIDWYTENKPWEFLTKLAEKAIKAQSLDITDFDPTLRYRNGYLKGLKARMLGLPNFPKDFDEYILTEGRGSYRLHLDAQDIHIFVLDSKEVLKPYTGD